VSFENMVKGSVFIIGLMLSVAGISCMNGYEVRNASGEWVDIHDEFDPIRTLFDTVGHGKKIASAQQQYDETGNIDFLVDKGILLAEIGQYGEATMLFQELQKVDPKSYKVNANLGTCYELTGEVDSAYKYIKRSMKLNKNSHYGSEYIHLAVLQFKKKGDSEVFFDDQLVKYPSTIDHYKGQEIANHIVHQLRERIPYSSVPDPAVGNLLETLGDLYREHGNGIDAYYAYKMARPYYGKETERLKSKTDSLKIQLKKIKQRPTRINDFLDPIRLKDSELKEQKRLHLLEKKRISAEKKREEERIQDSLKQIGEEITSEDEPMDSESHPDIVSEEKGRSDYWMESVIGVVITVLVVVGFLFNRFRLKSPNT
jgi:tetratricopeptide (TPR) repeat protein